MTLRRSLSPGFEDAIDLVAEDGDDVPVVEGADRTHLKEGEGGCW